MKRAVLDTNVIISALLFGGLPEKVVVQVLAGDHISVTSPFIIEETSRILRDKFNVAPGTLKMLEQLLSISEIQYFQPFLTVIEDDPDNRVLETAVHGKADYTVTGDKLLLELKCYGSIKIISPADFPALNSPSQ
ncbi:putative toxin-antitoxin system toxin component, PIN family [Candidatus Parcubacteria bacterium]|nr:putative toxin-antitoxin system toxin component, PIN family [Candidatus Parcubacteria bacterium]